MSGIYQEQPGAGEARRRLISKWHAQGHDALDAHGIPRFADGLEYTIAERIALLAAGTPTETAATGVTLRTRWSPEQEREVIANMAAGQANTMQPTQPPAEDTDTLRKVPDPAMVVRAANRLRELEVQAVAGIPNDATYAAADSILRAAFEDTDTLRARIVGALLQQAQDCGHAFPPGVESYAYAVLDALLSPPVRDEAATEDER